MFLKTLKNIKSLKYFLLIIYSDIHKELNIYYKLFKLFI